MIRIEDFLERTGQSKADVLRALGEDPKFSLLSAYASGRSKPSFDMCQRLLMNGMSISEMFGEEVAKKVRDVFHLIEGAKLTDQPRDVVIKGLRDILEELETKSEK